MWKLLACTLLVTPSLAHAADACKFEAPRNATLDFTGVHTLVIELHQHNLHLNGGPTPAGQIHGRACASSQDRLNALQIVQHREGDRLIVNAQDGNRSWSGISLFGDHYDYLDLQVDIPANVAVELNVGSGDANVKNIAELAAHVGSGDLQVNGVHGRFGAHVGSGDIKAEDVGETHVDAVGSGDFTVNRVRGDVRVGSVGSGDVDLRAVGGSVDVGSIGSGELRVNGVAHDLHVASVGSGDISHSAVAGKVDIPKQD